MCASGRYVWWGQHCSRRAHCEWHAGCFIAKKTFLCIAIEYSACGRTFECTLDGLVSNKAESPFKNDTHLPRCVGADIKSLGKINKINTLFMVVNLADF